ncbi:hypothetical protein Tco_1157048 [Tanacetum coccineum]
MGRDTVQLETAVSTISQEYLLEFTSEYDISEGLHPELPGRGDRIVDFSEGKVGVYTKFFEFANFRIPISQFLFDILGHYQIHLSQLSVIGAAKNWNNRFFWVDEKVFPTVVDWRISAPKDGMPAGDTYSVEDVVLLNTRRTPIQKQPELLLCLVGLSRRYFLGDDVYPTFLYDDGREMDLFNLISAPNPAIVKTGTRQRAAHEVPLLTATASRVIDMEDVVATSTSSGTPAAIDKSPLDFSNKDPPPMITNQDETEIQIPAETSREAPHVQDTTTTEVAPEVNLEREVSAMGPLVNKRHRKRDQRAGFTVPTPIPHETPADVIGPDLLSYARSQTSKGTAAAEDHESEKSTSFTSLAGSPGGYFSELRHLPNPEFLSQYNMTLARQVAMGSHLRLKFEQEVRLRREATAKIVRRDQRILAREEEIKKLDEEVQSLRVVETEVHGLRNRTQNLETLLEAEVDMKKVAKAKNAELVSTLQSQITGEEKIKAVFEEFKRYEDDRVSSRYAEMDARMDSLSIDFDEELYPHILTAIAGRRWVIGLGLRLDVLKCAESIELRQAFANVVSAGIAKGFCDGLKYGVELGEVRLDLANIEAYDPEVEGKFTTTMQALKDLKYPLIDELEKLKDAPMDIIMASLYLESDTGEDAPQWIRDLRPSSLQLKILLYPEVRDSKGPWAFKEELLLKDAITANVSRAEKKRKCRIVCRTHGVGSAHHARSDGIPVSIPTAPQGLQILLKDAASQTELPEDGASPRLVRSKSLPAMYNLDWPLAVVPPVVL